MKVTQITLRPGVQLTAVQTKKFKSSTLAVRFLTPLSEEDASRNALVPIDVYKRQGRGRYSRGR